MRDASVTVVLRKEMSHPFPSVEQYFWSAKNQTRWFSQGESCFFKGFPDRNEMFYVAPSEVPATETVVGTDGLRFGTIF